MSEHDASRREFLVRAAVSAGAVAGAGLVPGAIAQNREQMESGAAVADAQHPSGREHGAFFNHADAATIAAFTERLMPGAPGKPGARDADVLNYIDLALAGAYAELQEFLPARPGAAGRLLPQEIIKRPSCTSRPKSRMR